MTQRTRILLAVAILAAISLSVLGIEQWRRARQTISEADLLPGSIPIYLNATLVAGFQPTDLEQLEKVSFVDAEEGKSQEGWMLRDVMLVHMPRTRLKGETVITVSSSSRNKSVQLTWAEVEDPANWVMFDLAGRGTLKLVSTLERLDTRDEWIQDVDRIEVQAE